MTRTEIYKFYESKISDIEDEEKREELLNRLEEVDTMLFEIDAEVDEAIEEQESDYLPTQTEYRQDFENSRKGMML